MFKLWFSRKTNFYFLVLVFKKLRKRRFSKKGKGHIEVKIRRNRNLQQLKQKTTRHYHERINETQNEKKVNKAS